MKNLNRLYWLIAFLIGTMLNTTLFFVLPNLGHSKQIPKPEIITVEFMAWQQPAKKPPNKLEPVKKKKPVPKKKKKPKPKKPKPIVKPKPKPVKKPVLTEKIEPKTPEPPPEEPIPDPVEEAPIKPVEKIEEELEPIEEALPVPAPVFKLTSMPRMVHQSPLEYPPSMQAQGREAVVKLAILLDVKGKVRKITVEKSGGEAFDKAAIESMRKSKFLPGNIKGKPVAVLLKKKIRFRLQ